MTKHSLLLAALLLAPLSGRADAKSQAERRAAQEVYWSVGADPISMDPNKQVDAWESGMWLGHLYEGLLRYDEKAALGPGTAESYTVSADRKLWRFTIRKNARWHDGKPVTAHDFEYTFKRLVDPAYASVYSFIAITAGIDNASAVIAGKLPPDRLGVRATGDRTLEIRLERPVAFFESLMAFQAFFPVRKDLVEKYGAAFAVDPASIVGNGPFRLARWQAGSSMRIEKADTYWDAARVHLSAIESPAMVKDQQADFNTFTTGGIDFVPTNTPDLVRQAQRAKVKLLPFNSGCVNYLGMNVRDGRPFAARELRLAVQRGLNRTEFVNKIVATPGYKPAFGFVPDYLPGSRPGLTYRKEAPLSWKDGDEAKAKEYVQAYLKRTGKTQVPSFTLLALDTSRDRDFSVYLQNSLARILGTEVKVQNLTTKIKAQRTRDFDYDMAVGMWCPDYNDPLTYMDFYTSTNVNNTTGWHDPKFDALIERAGLEPDLATRVRLFSEAEHLYVDAAPSVAYFQSGGAYAVAPGLVGVRRSIFGVDPDFRFASWDAGTAGH